MARGNKRGVPSAFALLGALLVLLLGVVPVPLAIVASHAAPLKAMFRVAFYNVFEGAPRGTGRRAKLQSYLARRKHGVVGLSELNGFDPDQLAELGRDVSCSGSAIVDTARTCTRSFRLLCSLLFSPLLF